MFVNDSLDRVASSTLNGSTNLTIGYNLIGNITSKSDVGSGTWTYHASKKHAVTGAASNVYSYDADGNMSSRNGSSTTWTSYNYPSQINGTGGVSSQFSYGPDRQRFRQVAVESGSTTTTHYVGGILEKVVNATNTQYRHHIEAPGGLVAAYVRRSSGVPEDTYYFTKDHLGSLDSVTDATGSVRVRLSYDAFGGRRKEAGWSGAVPSADLSEIGNTTPRGFTGHEMLDNLKLVHMNGRVYDSKIGRFLSADPVPGLLQNPQSLNRYSYVSNRPLSLTDPSGFCSATSIALFPGNDGSNSPSFNVSVECRDMGPTIPNATVQGGGGRGGGGANPVSGGLFSQGGEGADVLNELGVTVFNPTAGPIVLDPKLAKKMWSWFEYGNLAGETISTTMQVGLADIRQYRRTDGLHLPTPQGSAFDWRKVDWSKYDKGGTEEDVMRNFLRSVLGSAEGGD